MIAGLLLTRLDRISLEAGDVLHGMKEGDPGFAGFGEAYFSTVHQGVTKGWKRHRLMTINLIVLQGQIRFVVWDHLLETATFTLSPDRMESYCRLTVPPGVWFAFRGEEGRANMLVNIANLRHDPAEVETAPLETFPFETRMDRHEI